METLLQKAKAIKTKKEPKINPDDKQIKELVIAWCKDEINITQLSKVLGIKNPPNAFPTIANCLKILYTEKVNSKK